MKVFDFAYSLQTVEMPGVKMLHYCGGLNFASRLSFRSEVYKIAGVVPNQELIRRTKLPAKEASRAKNKNGVREENHLTIFVI